MQLSDSNEHCQAGIQLSTACSAIAAAAAHPLPALTVLIRSIHLLQAQGPHKLHRVIGQAGDGQGGSRVQILCKRDDTRGGAGGVSGMDGAEGSNCGCSRQQLCGQAELDLYKHAQRTDIAPS